MDRRPYRSHPPTDGPVGAPTPRLDPMALGTLGFLLLLSIGRACTSWRAGNVDEEFLMAIGVGAAAAWGLARHLLRGRPRRAGGR